MGIYAKAVTADKRHAPDAIAALFVSNSTRVQTQQTWRQHRQSGRWPLLALHLAPFGLCRTAKLLM